VTKILERENVTRPGEDGWSYLYRIRRNDGEEVTVAVSCARTATAVATLRDNAAALTSMRDDGVGDAMRVAELVASPAQCGRTHVRMFYSLVDGSLQWRSECERPSTAPHRIGTTA
jgi:hypothetical protein